MNWVLKIFLKILPLYSLVAIVLSAFRTVYGDSYGEYLLLFLAIIDSILIVTFWKKLTKHKIITFVLLLLTLSLFVGLLNGNEITRRYITDFTNPLFFFCKIFIMASLWHVISFEEYMRYYIKVAFWGSLILLPVTYFLFQSAGATRLAIFPPLELPFSYFMQGGYTFFIGSCLMILLYGKRAQLVGAIGTFLLFIFIFKRKQFFKYLLIFGLLALVFSLFINQFSDNLAVKRLTRTVEVFNSDDGDQTGFDQVSGSRKVEVESIMNNMNTRVDYFFGKGLGFTYLFEYYHIYKVHANAHFSPVALWSKYGIIFTVFFYGFILKLLLKKVQNYSRTYLTAVATCLFVFIESFFAYAFFVTVIFPVAFSYVLYYQKNQNLPLK